MVIIIQVIQTAHIMSESDPLGNHLRYVRNITAVTHEIIKSGEIQKCGELVVYTTNSYPARNVSGTQLWRNVSVHGTVIALLNE